MFDELMALRPGYVIAAACGLIAIGVLVAIGVRSLRSVRWTAPRPPARHEAGPAEPSPVEPVLEPVVPPAPFGVDGLRNLGALQEQLNRQLDMTRAALAAERESVLSSVEARREFAREKRLPTTLYEMFESMRYFWRKSPEAQQADLEWHGQTGISEISAAPIRISEIGARIAFRLYGRQYHLLGKVHTFTRTDFTELTLYDEDHEPLFIARVKTDDGGRQIEAEAVLAFRPGPWLADVLACRARMDQRQAELALRASHRDVEKLKRDFGIDVDVTADPRLH